MCSGKKNLPTNAGDARDMGSILGSGRSLRGGNGNPLQYPCLENPMNRGAWGLRSIGLQSQTQLSEHSRAFPRRWLRNELLCHKQSHDEAADVFSWKACEVWSQCRIRCLGLELDW